MPFSCAPNTVKISPTSVHPCTLQLKFFPPPTHLNVFSKMSDFFSFCFSLFAPNFYLSSLTWFTPHSPLSISSSPLFPPSSFHYTILAPPKINHGSNTPPSPSLCSLSLYLPNPSLTTQLSYVWRISSGWVVYICGRPNINHPFLFDFGKTSCTPPGSSMQNQESSIYSHTHEYQFIEKSYKLSSSQPTCGQGYPTNKE